MADTILTAALSRPQFVATNEALKTVVWKGLAVVDVDVESVAAVTDMPLAIDGPKDSATTSVILEDDMKAIKIIQPSRLRVNAIISDISIIENIITVFRDETASLSVTTKSIITDFLIMTEVTIEQANDMINASRVSMTFEQARPPKGSGFVPEQAADASMYGVGVQNLQDVRPMWTLNKTIAEVLKRPPIPLPPGVLIDNKGGPFILNKSRLG